MDLSKPVPQKPQEEKLVCGCEHNSRLDRDFGR